MRRNLESYFSAKCALLNRLIERGHQELVDSLQDAITLPASLKISVIGLSSHILRPRSSSPEFGAVTRFHQLNYAYTHGHLQGLAEYQYPVATGPTVWRENRFLKLPTSVKVVCSHALAGGWGQSPGSRNPRGPPLKASSLKLGLN